MYMCVYMYVYIYQIWHFSGLPQKVSSLPAVGTQVALLYETSLHKGLGTDLGSHPAAATALVSLSKRAGREKT